MLLNILPGKQSEICDTNVCVAISSGMGTKRWVQRRAPDMAYNCFGEPTKNTGPRGSDRGHVDWTAIPNPCDHWVRFH